MKAISSTRMRVRRASCSCDWLYEAQPGASFFSRRKPHGPKFEQDKCHGSRRSSLSRSMPIALVLPSNGNSYARILTTATWNLRQTKGLTPGHGVSQEAGWPSDRRWKTRLCAGAQSDFSRSLITARTPSATLNAVHEYPKHSLVGPHLSLVRFPCIATPLPQLDDSEGVDSSEMIDWHSPEVLRICYDSLGDVASVTLGAFIWYMMVTFDEIEWQLLKGKLQFTPAVHIPYLVGRYAYLIACASFVTVLHWDSSAGLDCQVVMLLMAIAGDLCIVASSMNMMNRVRAVWRDNHIIKGIVILCTLGHIIMAVMVPVVGIRVFWDPREAMCQALTEHNATNMFAFYLYTCIWDLVILALTIWGLRRERQAWDSSLGLDLRYQGALYIVCAFVTNILVMVFALKNFNALMDIILTAPAGALNVMVSSYMVACFMDIKEDEVPNAIADPTTWLNSDAKHNGSTASTIMDMTYAFERTSSETQDGRYGADTPQIRVESPSSIEDDMSSTCYSSENPMSLHCTD